MTTIETFAKKAIAGDKDALNHLASALQDDIYGLSFRMLCNREDAEDATQEILIRVVTRLSQFDFRSKLRTWAYRIAVNYILDVKKSAIERMRLSFEQFSEEITKGIGGDTIPETEQSLLIEEVKIGCTFGMLQCLDRTDRFAYILGEIMDLPGPEAAEILNLSAELFSQAPSTCARVDSRVHEEALRAGVRFRAMPLQPAGSRLALCRKNQRTRLQVCGHRYVI